MVDNNVLANGRNYHLASCGYIDAAEILLFGYTKVGISKNTIMYHQMLPLYYLSQMSIEMFLKSRLIINGLEPKTLRTPRQGHDLKWLLKEFQKHQNSIDKHFQSMIQAISNGEYRYPNIFTGGGRIEQVNEVECIRFLKKYTEENHSKLQELDNASH